jgi:hypothetical protein
MNFILKVLATCSFDRTAAVWEEVPNEPGTANVVSRNMAIATGQFFEFFLYIFNHTSYKKIEKFISGGST